MPGCNPSVHPLPRLSAVPVFRAAIGSADSGPCKREPLIATYFFNGRTGPKAWTHLPAPELHGKRMLRPAGLSPRTPSSGPVRSPSTSKSSRTVEMIEKGQTPPEMRAHLYLPLCDVLGPQATTRDSDETLCLSTVLGLDPKPFLDIENGDDDEDAVQRRMKAFLRTLGEFNSALIFNSYRKLGRDGVRWEPRSLLRHRTADLGPVFLSDQTAQIATVNQYSELAVRFPGFLIGGNSGLSSSRGMAVSLDESDTLVFLEVVVCEEESTTVVWDKDSQYAVIWPGNDLEQLCQEGCRGIIAQVQAGIDHGINGEDITVVRYQCGVLITNRKRNVQTEVVLVRGRSSQWLVM